MESKILIKQIRLKTGMTNQEIADKIGVSRRTVEGWASGRKPSKIAILALDRIKWFKWVIIE
jgi:DNA-binding transcriptional regulator YiaG